MENTPNPANVGETTQEHFGIQNIYIKDISFETPNSPQIFKEQWKPELELEMSNEVNSLDKGTYEVVLNLTATVKIGEKTAFLAEVHQAGIFALTGFSQEQLSYMLHGYCPNILFPFARETVANLVSRGGFQPLWLAPINFDALYAEQLQQKQQKAQQPTAN